MIQRFFEEQRHTISMYIQSFLQNREDELSEVHELGQDSIRRLRDFTVKGKMIRGCLAILGNRLFSTEAHPEAPALGAAMEFFQSALLVHDDIMDRDTERRGHPSLYHQYALFSKSRGASDTAHTGEALGICTGDIAFFLGYEIIGSIRGPDRFRQEAVRYCSRELSRVAAAQMGDVLNGVIRGPLSREQILNLYTNKTGRYTFSMPLALGALLADTSPEIILSLEHVGELFGKIFQIKDDELGLYGDEHTLGKPLGSDVQEGKKTLYHHYLYALSPPSVQRELDTLFGNPHVSDSELKRIRDLIDELNIQSRIDDEISKMTGVLTREIAALPGLGDNHRSLLLELIEYSISRKH